MKANELRIGNFVYWVYPDKDSNKEIQQVSISTFYNVYDSGWDIEKYYSPIPLTPEILEKAGFEMPAKVKDINGDFFITDYMDKDICLQFEKQCGSEYVVEQLIFKHIKYVHQLQNLYFALTGEELEVNL